MPTEEKIKKNFQNSETVIVLRIMLEHQIHLDVCIWILGTKTWRQNTKFRSYLWFAGLNSKKIRDKTFLSRVDIELINEQIKFLSDQDVVTTYDETFTITENTSLGLNDKTSYYPWETSIYFMKMYYTNRKRDAFPTTGIQPKMLYHIYNSNLLF
jgi:hypothetical protein